MMVEKVLGRLNSMACAAYNNSMANIFSRLHKINAEFCIREVSDEIQITADFKKSKS